MLEIWSFTALLAAFHFTGLARASVDPIITPKPQVPKRLLPRQDDTGPNVYGYISGDANSPLGCGAGYQFAAESGGCCNQVACTDIIYTCVGRNGGQDPCTGAMADVCSMASMSVLHCKSPDPYCFRYMRITDAQDLAPVYLHRCGTVSGDVTVLVASTGDAAIQTVDSPATAKESSARRSSVPPSVRSQGGSPGLPVETSASSESGGRQPTNTTSSGVWKYAVIGVGVVIAVALIAVAIFCLRPRLREDRKRKSHGIASQLGDMAPMATDTESVMGRPMTFQKRRDVTAWAHSSQGSERRAPSPVSEEQTLTHSNAGSRDGSKS